VSEELRCPSCRALVSADAEWCGQCFAVLHAGSASAHGLTPAVERPILRRDRETNDLTWTCPGCGTESLLSQDRCERCGTPFAQLFQETPAGGTEPPLSPGQALGWSLLFPGLGHWRLGRPLDGLARVVLFTWVFGTVVVLLVSGWGKAGLGPMASLFWLFLGSSILLYVTSAVDAHRIALDEEPLVSSRTLVWCSVALVLLSVMLATLLALPAARGQ